MTSLADLFHDAAMFLALNVEDAAAVIFEDAQKRVDRSQRSEPHWPIFLAAALPYAALGLGSSPGWPLHAQQAVQYALAEAIYWLKRKGLVMYGLVGTQVGPGKLVFTRRGLQLRTKVDVTRYREVSALPTALVHSSIVGRVIPLFSSGDRDGAVLMAFRAVEIAVRTAAGWDGKKFGVYMMQEAFSPGRGVLTDQSLPMAEREAEQALFAGAFGHGRNPVNHRDLNMGPVEIQSWVVGRHTINRDLNMGPVEAARLILLASHLLTIVEKRPAGQEGPDE